MDFSLFAAPISLYFQPCMEFEHPHQVDISTRGSYF